VNRSSYTRRDTYLAPQFNQGQMRSRLPALYLPLLVIAVIVSLASGLTGSRDILVSATWISALIGLYILLNDAFLMWAKGGIVGRLTINFGIFYWFWFGAWHSASGSEAFPTPDILYPGFWGGVPTTVVARSLIGINLFAITAMLGWRYVPQPARILRLLADRVDPRSTNWLDLLALILVLLAWFSLFFAYGGNLGAAFHDLLIMRSDGQLGAVRDVGLVHHLRLLGVFGAALALVRIVLKSPGTPLLRYLTVALMFPILFFGQGSRFNFGYLFMPAVIVLMAPSRHKVSWLNRRKSLLMVLAIGALLVTYQGAIRTEGFQAKRFAEVELEAGLYGHDHFGAMMIAVDLADTQGFYYEPISPFFVTHFIPKAIWENKPYPQSWLDYNYAWTQGGAFNVTPSITGQYYLNWGFAGVLYIGFFIGWLSRFCESWFARLDVQRQFMSATVAGLLLSFVFLSFRFFYPLYFAYPLFGFLAYWILTRKREPRGGVRLPFGAR
jgi:oligosaccharide repeat unit polymerase